MANPKMEAPTKLPLLDDLFLKAPLYRKYPFLPGDHASITFLRYESQQIDCYCVECKRDSTFKADEIPYEITQVYNGGDFVFSRTFTCSRNDAHEQTYIFRTEDERLLKIGQYPSARELASAEINKYAKLLGNDAEEFKTAISLFANGIGVGAFVYLRRIIENLLEEIHKEAAKEPDWIEEDYRKMKVGERMKLFAAKLPDVLRENPKLYGILSKGLHQLTEEECLDAFRPIKAAIQLILNEKLEIQEKEALKKEARAGLQKLGEKHN